MIRICKMSGKLYGYDMRNKDNDEVVEDIEGFVNEGTPVIVVNDLDDLEAFDIDPSEVKMVS